MCWKYLVKTLFGVSFMSSTALKGAVSGLDCAQSSALPLCEAGTTGKYIISELWGFSFSVVMWWWCENKLKSGSVLEQNLIQINIQYPIYYQCKPCLVSRPTP